MKITTLFAIALMALSFAPVNAQQIDYAAHGETPFEDGELLVKISDVRKAERLFTDLAEINGVTTKLAMGRVVSGSMDIYLLTFDQDAINPFTMLERVKAHSAIDVAQFNHHVYLRETVPNDPNFDEQWHHVNTGQTGGTTDADIDSDLAWDITTGGLTALGDEIVVCVIEGGNLNHPDLAPNAWVNEQEIPSNGIDDDGNGYVDDYLGWNVASNNDQGVLSGGHGTQVFGMIGAKGDNNLGVVGANWDVKLMSVAGENLGNESSVVAAYTYALDMRQLYNNSNGASGAFVVATNASWGIDNGNPDNYPLWCGVYETLGENGILSCGATANNNVNIDQVGDLPTACASEYMISVTATNNNDVRTFSGYGITTIDVGAPGSNVVTTSGSNGYGSTSGTSFASPLTAGVIALLYSAPCPSLIQIAKANPQLGADLVREALFEGVDIIPNLINEVATGGRINAYNSLMHIINNCADAGCLAPFSLTGVQTPNTSSYTLSWGGLDPVSYDLRYRPTSETTWIEVNGLTEATYFLADLTFCTEYEYQVRANCEEETSEYSDSFVWTTDGCCENPAFSVGPVTSTSADVSWESVLAAESYNIRYRVAGSTDWTQINEIEELTTSINGLEECTFYEIQIQTNCIGSDETMFSSSTTFNTSGCGSCQDLEYCSSGGDNSSEEWIASVSFTSFENVSGNDGGYGDYTDQTHLMVAGSTQEVTLTPGFAESPFNEHFIIWIDYNQDGEFGAGEMVYDSGTGITEAVSGSFVIPGTANIGATRMRVSMKYVGGGFFGPPDPAPTSCETFDWGETEDYCVFIDNTSSTDETELVSVGVFPNPASDVVWIDLSQTDIVTANMQYHLMDMTGRVIESSRLSENRMSIDVKSLPAGVYSLLIYDDNRRIAQEQVVIVK